jgi:hypothetical protein
MIRPVPRDDHEPPLSRDRILLKRIRWTTGFFIFGLAASGVTAIPLVGELHLLVKMFDPSQASSSGLEQWLLRVRDALTQTQSQNPFLFYGTDWLAFGHFTIALVFIGALRDPVRNRWLFDFGLLACELVIPYAFVFGEMRGIPIWWRLIDCCFGVIGFFPLWFCRRWAIELEHLTPSTRRLK